MDVVFWKGARKREGDQQRGTRRGRCRLTILVMDILFLALLFHQQCTFVHTCCPVHRPFGDQDLAKGRKLATQLASDTAAMRTEVQKLRTQV